MKLSDAVKIYAGASETAKAFLGAEEIWSAGGGPPANWLEGWLYRKGVTLSRASGAVSNYRMELFVGETADIQVTGCENGTHWYTYDVNLSLVAGYEGTNCIKIAAAGTNPQVWFAFTAQDWDSSPLLTFWQKRDGSSDTLGRVFVTNGNYYNYIFFDYIMTDEWTKITFDLRKPTGLSATPMDWTNVDRIYFGMPSSTTGTNLYIDDVRRGPDVGCGGLCASDFDDIRFTNSDGMTLLDYCIKSISGTTPNQGAVIYSEFDYIDTTPTNFYMYYGNAGAAAASNIKSVFPVGDDFNDNSIDTNLWDETDPNSRVAESGGTLQLANSHAAIITWFVDKLVSKTTFNSNIVNLQCNLTWITNSANEAQGGVFLAVDINNFAYIGSRADSGNYRIIIKKNNVSVYDISGPVKNKIVRITYNIANKLISFWYSNNGIWVQIGTSQTQDIGSVCSATLTSSDHTIFTGANPIIVDNLCFWNSLAVEPVWGEWGEQEAA